MAPLVFVQQLGEDLAGQNLVGYVHQDDSGHKVHPLRVAELRVEYESVDLE